MLHCIKKVAAVAALGAWLVSGTAQVWAEELGTLEEMIVTSRKRVENLQETPLSETALTAHDLQDRLADNVADIGPFIPNLELNRSSPISGLRQSVSVFIRGIGQTDFTLTTDPGVGVYVDDVYLARSFESAVDLIDIERVEVLRGPQGTLFGRNTIGGAISLTTQKPEAARQGAVTLTTGSYGRRDVHGSVEGALGKTVFASAALTRYDSDGTISRPQLGDTTGETDAWSARLALRWLPSARFELNASFDATRHDENACCEQLLKFYPGLVTSFYNAVVAPAGGLPPATDAYVSDRLVDQSLTTTQPHVRHYGGTVNAQWQLSDSLTLKSISSWRKLESSMVVDLDHTPARLLDAHDRYDAHQLSQELQLHGTALDKRVNWIGGAYFFDEHGDNPDRVRFAIMDLQSGGRVTNRSFALFGQSNYSLTSKLTLTGGLRFTRDEKTFTPENNVLIQNFALGTPFESVFPIPSGIPLVPPGTVGRLDDRRTTPYAAVSYGWTPQVMSYLSYSEGFKSGGLVQRLSGPTPVVPSFDPELVRVTEAGLKTTLFGNRLHLNGAAFHTDYTDMQIGVFVNGAPLTRNAAGAKIDGLEVEAVGLPRPGLKLEAGAGYLNGRYTRIDPSVLTDVRVGDRLVNAPRWSLSAAASYAMAVSERWSIVPRVDWAYHSITARDAANTPELIQPGYHLVNASFTLESRDEKWEVQAFGTNLLNERYLISGTSSVAFNGFVTGAYGRPVEWGLRVGRRF